MTYTRPGQPIWGATSPDAAARPDGQHTFGGWYASTVELKLAQEEIGLSAMPSSPGSDGFWSKGATCAHGLGTGDQVGADGLASTVPI